MGKMNKMQERITVVTGATGHIGNVLARQLILSGQRVRCLVLPGEDLAPLSGLPLEVIPGNVLDRESLRRAFTGATIVYHLAGMISILPGRDERVYQVNVTGTRNVLQAAREMDVRRLVYTSSIHAIARLPHGTTIDETAPFDPDRALSEYDRSKALASLIVLEAVRNGQDAVIACPTGVIGPYDYRRSEMGQLISDCMQQRLQLWVDGAYDFVDVRDVAHGLLSAGENGRSGESYILSGERITLGALMQQVSRLAGHQPLRLRLPPFLARWAAPFAALHYRLWKLRPRFTPYALETVASNSTISHQKASRELGYQPRSLSQSLADTVTWFSQQKPARYHAVH